MSSNPLRVIIRVHVLDIPADPSTRMYRLGNDFSEQVLGRPIRIRVQPGGFDALHFLPGFDSDKDTKACFIYDFNVTGPLYKNKLQSITHEVYHATRKEDSR